MPSRSEAPTRRRLSPEQRRSELIDAALVELRARGSDCTVEDITSSAGTAKGNFYRYFDTWGDMLDAARDRLIDEYRAGLGARLASAGDDWWALIEMEIPHYIDYQLGLGPLHELLFHRPDAGSFADGDAPQMLAALLEAGHADGAFREVDAEPVARLLFHALHGAADDVAAGADRARTEGALLALFRSTLVP